ncbi:MAG: uroporphyrinogen-III synthase [Gammaproteobacteria bacterium]|jgi:uroporphyrinogen-III synthase
MKLPTPLSSTLPKSTLLSQHVVLNTRPAHQQAVLNKLLQLQGATMLTFPGIEIVECDATEFHLNLDQHINHYDIALFVSRNAVEGAFRFMKVNQLPSHLEFGVIGESTYQALTTQISHLTNRLIHSPSDSNALFNSESLLAAAKLQQVEGKNIIIFRGQQGRNLLGDELLSRRANVHYCEVYRRQLPQYDAHHYQKLCRNNSPTIAVFTSTEGMHNTIKAVDSLSHSRLLKTPWLLISERMRESAVNLGHNASIIIANNASDEGIQLAITEWASEQAVWNL